MEPDDIIYQTGIPEEFRSAAANLYDEAFGKKISVAVRNEEKRRHIIKNCLVLEYAIGALARNHLIGIAGFHTLDGSLTGGIGHRYLLTQLGFIRGYWAALIFSLYERKPKPGELVMDGIAVRSDARGRGIGTRLLKEIRKLAEQQGFNHVRLDVIDINPKAKKLYERMGFKAVKTESFPYLKGLLGFGGVTTMVLEIKANT